MKSKWFATFVTGMLLVVTGLLAGCGSGSSMVATPVFNTGGQILLEGWDGAAWGAVVATSDHALLRVTVGTSREVTNVTVRLVETTDGRITATVTADGVPAATNKVAIATNQWLLWPQLEVLDNIQARGGRGNYITTSKDGAEFRLGDMGAGRQRMLTLHLPVSVYE